MKTLFLNRHAKSDWSKEGQRDFDRTLNPRGLTDAPEMGKILKARENTIDIFISSPANRALTTAGLIAEQMNYPKEKIQETHALYQAEIPDFLKVINAIDDEFDRAIIFSHNPGITDAATYLCGEPIGSMPTCAVIKINFHVDSWKEVSKENGTMEYFDFPKNH